MFFAVAVKVLWIQIVSGTELGTRATVQVTDKINAKFGDDTIEFG